MLWVGLSLTVSFVQPLASDLELTHSFSCACTPNEPVRFALPDLDGICSSESYPPPTDYSVFASTGFDANDYANAVLAGEAYPHTISAKAAPTRTLTSSRYAKEDVSVAIAKLDAGIEDISKQLKSVVRVLKVCELKYALLMLYCSFLYQGHKSPRSAACARSEHERFTGLADYRARGAG
jgi:hypothetical protein